MLLGTKAFHSESWKALVPFTFNAFNSSFERHLVVTSTNTNALVRPCLTDQACTPEGAVALLREGLRTVLISSLLPQRHSVKTLFTVREDSLLCTQPMPLFLSIYIYIVMIESSKTRQESPQTNEACLISVTPFREQFCFMAFLIRDWLFFFFFYWGLISNAITGWQWLWESLRCEEQLCSAFFEKKKKQACLFCPYCTGSVVHMGSFQVCSSVSETDAFCSFCSCCCCCGSFGGPHSCGTLLYLHLKKKYLWEGTDRLTFGKRLLLSSVKIHSPALCWIKKGHGLTQAPQASLCKSMTFELHQDNEYNKVYRMFTVHLMNIPSSIQLRLGERGAAAVRQFAAITLRTICNFIFISLKVIHRCLIFASVNKQHQLPALVHFDTLLHTASQIWALWALTLAAN